METGRIESETRRLLLGTVHGLIEGSIAVGPQVRTLDYLNRAATRFLMLRGVKSLSANPLFQSESVCVSMATILWVSEVEAMRRSGLLPARPGFNRCAVRMCFADFEALGYLHAPAQGDPFARLNQDRGAFIALTSASVIGPETEISAAFLALNSLNVFTAELVAQDDAALEGTSLFEQIEP